MPFQAYLYFIENWIRTFLRLIVVPNLRDIDGFIISVIHPYKFHFCVVSIYVIKSYPISNTVGNFGLPSDQYVIAWFQVEFGS